MYDGSDCQRHGLGLFNTSLGLLGGAGAGGNANLGRSGEGVYLNAATGNLVLQRQCCAPRYRRTLSQILIEAIRKDLAQFPTLPSWDFAACARLAS